MSATNYLIELPGVFPPSNFSNLSSSSVKQINQQVARSSKLEQVTASSNDNLLGGITWVLNLLGKNAHVMQSFEAASTNCQDHVVDPCFRARLRVNIFV